MTTRIPVGPDRSISGVAAEQVRVEVPEWPARQLPTEPLDVYTLPAHDLGLWPEGMSLRREDLYGDDGR